eukprot:2179454-Pyramimonas_sp.AAC.1
MALPANGAFVVGRVDFSRGASSPNAYFKSMRRRSPTLTRASSRSNILCIGDAVRLEALQRCSKRTNEPSFV